MEMIQCNTNLGHVNIMSYSASTDRHGKIFRKIEQLTQDYKRPNGDVNQFQPEHPQTLRATLQFAVAQV